MRDMLQGRIVGGGRGAAGAGGARAQEQRPMSPPPEHDVKRLGNTPEAVEPPSLPPDQIIRKFVAKEDRVRVGTADVCGEEDDSNQRVRQGGDDHRGIFAGVGSDADAGWARGEQGAGASAIDAEDVCAGAGGRERAGADSAISDQFVAAGEIRSEIYRDGKGR